MYKNNLIEKNSEAYKLMLLIGNVSICLVRERYENKWGLKNLINTVKMKYLAFIEDSISGKKREKTKQEEKTKAISSPRFILYSIFMGSQ